MILDAVAEMVRAGRSAPAIGIPPARAGGTPGEAVAGSASERHAPVVVAFVTAVVAAAAIASVWTLAHAPPGAAPAILVWTLAALASQYLIFPTPSGRGEISLGLTIHLCMAMVLSPWVWLPSLWLSRAVAAATFQRKPWERALFNAAQVTLAVLGAAAVLRACGVPMRMDPTLAGLLRAAPGIVFAALAYYALNMTAVSTVLALSTGRTPWRAWRESFGFGVELLGAAGLASLAPVAALVDQSFGAPGLAMFFLPLAFLRDASARYVTLRRTQDALMDAERLAARAGLAAEIGHEINDSLTAVQGQLQLLQRTRQLSSEALDQRLSKVFEPLSRIDLLSKGLMDFSRQSTALEPVMLADVVATTVEFMRHQKRFAAIRFELDLDRSCGEVWADPVQLQQALMNLFLNAATAMKSTEPRRRTLGVTIRPPASGHEVEIRVTDAGPGIAPELRLRVFEPGFSTFHGGRGFGLTTVRSIVRAHHGRVHIDDAPGGGAAVVLALPLRRAA